LTSDGISPKMRDAATLGRENAAIGAVKPPQRHNQRHA
jgi:hypothetical protein